MDREVLYERIDARTEAIAPPAPPRRCARAEAAGPSRTARKALGFDELLGGDLELMKKRSRNYARRQLTWMRKIPNLEWIDRGGRGDAEIAAEIVTRLTDRPPEHLRHWRPRWRRRARSPTCPGPRAAADRQRPPAALRRACT